MNVVTHRQVLLQQRLNALQLKVWYPRQPMAGSRIEFMPPVATEPELTTEPVAIEPELAAEPIAIEPELAAEPVAIEPERAATAAPISPPPRSTAHHGASISTGSPQQMVKQTTRGVEFVQHWWFHQGLLLLDTRPTDAPSRHLAEADQLLSALLRICTQVPRPDLLWSIDWPLFEHRGIKHDWAEAQFYVQQRWQSFSAEHSVERVLMFGADTRALLGFAELELPSTQTWIETESTLQLLRSAAAKRALWQALQAWLGEV